jgi:hypothetical protein
MTVRRLPPLLLALVLGLLAAFAVACGDDGDDRKLLAPSRADAIVAELETIEERVAKGDCADLDPAFTRLNRAIDELPRSTDSRLRRRLAQGAENLQEIAPADCRENRPETTETEPETVETEPPATTETVPPPTTETTPPPTTTTPPTTGTTPPPEEPEEPVQPEDTGGDQAPGAKVPPGQAKKGEKG